MVKQKIQSLIFFVGAGIILGVLIPMSWAFTSLYIAVAGSSSSLLKSIFSSVGQTSTVPVNLFEFVVLALVCSAVAATVAFARHSRSATNNFSAASIALFILAFCASQMLMSWTNPLQSMHRACQIMNQDREGLLSEKDAELKAKRIEQNAKFAVGTAAHPKIHSLLAQLVPAMAYSDQASKVDLIFQAFDEVGYSYKNCPGFLFTALGPDEAAHDKAYQEYKAGPK
jgi:hypothetical protein